VSFTVAVLVLGGLAGLVVYALPHLNGDTKPAATAEAIAPEEVEAATPPPATYPLSKTVEVTGLRFVNDANKKPEVHYLVVNHSSAEMPAVTVYVSVRSSAAKTGQPPLVRFSFHSSALAPFEAKEMTSPLDKLPRQAEWQDLQAEVALGQ
jgi:hypothetical protein